MVTAPHTALLSLVRDGTLPSDLTVTLPLVDSAIEHGLAPLLDDAVQEHGIPGDQEAHMRLAAWSMESSRHAAQVSTALNVLIDAGDDLGIELAIFKGMSVSERWYDRPDLRPSYDIDVFVAPKDRDRIGDLVAVFEHSPEAQEAIAHMQAVERVFEHSTSIGDISIDIHSEPWLPLLIPKDRDTLWEHTEVLELSNGEKVRAPDLEMSLMIALIHNMKDNFADLLHISDVGRMIDAGPDWKLVSEFAATEGWTDILRFSLGFACDVLQKPSPLPRTLTPRSRALTSLLWPSRYLLKGALSVTTSYRRLYLLILLTRGRDADVARALSQRVLPPRDYVDYRYPCRRCPYLVALLRWRISQNREYRNHGARALNLREELAGEDRTRNGPS